MYDAIVVGARCAGSPVAMLLARLGRRVLVVDRATFPSDTISTATLWPPAVARLARWGLRPEVERQGAPMFGALTLDAGPFRLTGTPPPADGNRATSCCRRTILDQILVDAAAAAGAEIRQGFTVTGLVTEEGTVTGVRGHGRGGREVTEQARVVLGADGLHSRVAAMVGAARYHERPSLTCAYYSYFSGVEIEPTLAPRSRAAVGAMATNNGLTLGVVFVPALEAARFREDPEGMFWAAMDLAPELGERLRAGRREERFHGTADLPNFFRVSHGPGWALLGDAGFHKDPITGQGINDAFRDAEEAAGGIHRGLDDGGLDDHLRIYAEHRDAEVMPMYEFTLDMATLEPPTPELAALLEALQGQPEHIDRFLGVLAATVPVTEFMAPENLELIHSRPVGLAATPPW
ncbi:MAG: NAD(P)/FAD-dependent oxidoreductase [Acidimicrobiia bacterium]